MRVRITRRCSDVIDGLALDTLMVGLVYDVSPTVGSYLIANGCADAVLEDEVDRAAEEERHFRANVTRWREVAADIGRHPLRPRS